MLYEKSKQCEGCLEFSRRMVYGVEIAILSIMYSLVIIKSDI